MSQLFMTLCIVERRTSSNANFHTSYFDFILNCILFYENCVSINICTTTGTLLRLTVINKEI